MTTYRIELHGKGLDFLARSAKNNSTKKVTELISSHEQGILTREDIKAASRSLQLVGELRGALANEFTLYIKETDDLTQSLMLDSAIQLETSTLDSNSLEAADEAEGLFSALDWLEGQISAYQLKADNFFANNLVLMQTDISDLTDDADEIITACIYAEPQDLRNKFAAALDKATTAEEKEVLQELLEELDEDFLDEDYDSDDLAFLLENALEDLRDARGLEEESDNNQWFFTLLGNLVCKPIEQNSYTVTKTEVTFEEL